MMLEGRELDGGGSSWGRMCAEHGPIAMTAAASELEAPTSFPQFDRKVISHGHKPSSFVTLRPLSHIPTL